MRLIQKSKKLADVCYDIRGPVLEKARQMEEEGQRIIKLNIGNLTPFGFDPPDEIVRDMKLMGVKTVAELNRERLRWR